MPKHSNKFVKFFKKKGKFLVLGLVVLIVGVVVFLAFQEDIAVKTQKNEILKSKVIIRR